MLLQLETVSLRGSREENMDVWLLKEPFGEKKVWDTDISPLLGGVFDGVGSLHHSTLAASLAAEKLARVFYQVEKETVKERLLHAGWAANDKVVALNRSMGLFDAAATLTAGAFAGTRMHLLALGDSPGYLYRNKTLTPLFTPMRGDHGQLLGYLGQESPDFYTGEVELRDGDVVLLATDGIMPEKQLHWALQLGLSAKTIAWLSTRKRYADNATLIKITVQAGDCGKVM